MAYFAQLVGLAVVYFSIAKLGLMMDAVSGFATLVWPATGVAVAALFLVGLRLWPAVWAGAALVNWVCGAPPLAACGIGIGNCLEAVVGVVLLRRIGFRPALERLRDVLVLVVGVGVLATLISATVGVSTLFLARIVPATAFVRTWRAWWLGDVTAVLVVAPLLLAWGSPPPAVHTRRRLPETIALSLVIVATTLFIFSGESHALPAWLHQDHLVLLPLIWAALRFDTRHTTLAVFVVSAMATAATALGSGPFVRPTLHESLFVLQAFFAAIVATTLVLRGVTAERLASSANTTQALRRLKESSQLLEAVVEGTSDFIFVKDRSGRYVMMNSAARRSLGKRPDDVIGKDDTDLLPPAIAEQFRKTDLRVMESGVAEVVEETVPTLNGCRTFLSCKAPQRDADGSVVGLVGIARDITDRKQTEEALREADRRKDEFLAVLSHELRNPLAPIRTSMFILERVPPGGEQASRARAIIVRQVEHMTRLIEDLLDVTRISRGKIRLHRQRVDLSRLLRGAVDDQRDAFENAGVKLEVHIPGEPVWVIGDATRLAQVVGNLLQNSAKFTPRGGHATLSLALDDQRCSVIRIRDTGAGMHPETLQHVFEPFVQADRTLDRTRGGLGLGLALSKGIVEMHGGTVTANSDGPGEGAEFVVRIPAGNLLDKDAPAVHETTAPAARGARRVLVIEDNVDAAASLKETLEICEHVVAVAHTGPEGIDKAHAFRPDVVLCDIGLPGLDGYGVAAAMRADSLLKSTFLVALSGYALYDDVEKSKNAGFDRHLAKPPDMNALRMLLAEVPARVSVE